MLFRSQGAIGNLMHPQAVTPVGNYSNGMASGLGTLMSMGSMIPGIGSALGGFGQAMTPAAAGGFSNIGALGAGSAGLDIGSMFPSLFGGGGGAAAGLGLLAL